MRFASNFVIVALVFLGLWTLWTYNEHFRDTLSSYVENGEILTLEAHYTPEQIMDSHAKELLADKNYTFQPSSLKFYPYLFMDVKFTDKNRQTREGVILWSLVDGEMVLNTQTWDTTHGFEDALLADATRSDFLVMQALAKNLGSLSREQLHATLNAEPSLVDAWINQALQKHFIFEEGDEFYLHFEEPKILVTPETKINQWFVTKPYNHVQQISKRFKRSQIEGTAKAAFGDDFTIRDSKEVFLPVYSIEVLNPDGSILTSYWNALNGKRLRP